MPDNWTDDFPDPPDGPGIRADLVAYARESYNRMFGPEAELHGYAIWEPGGPPMVLRFTRYADGEALDVRGPCECWGHRLWREDPEMGMEVLRWLSRRDSYAAVMSTRDEPLLVYRETISSDDDRYEWSKRYPEPDADC